MTEIVRKFGGESFQVIDCTATHNQNKETKHYMEYIRETNKTTPANKTKFVLLAMSGFFLLLSETSRGSTPIAVLKTVRVRTRYMPRI